MRRRVERDDSGARGVPGSRRHLRNVEGVGVAEAAPAPFRLGLEPAQPTEQRSRPTSDPRPPGLPTGVAGGTGKRASFGVAVREN
ncbi:hypothetical protein HK405_007400, partial [Cladochytrium tenue]